jgi:hypothetical protein
MQRTIVYSELCVRENQGCKRADSAREPHTAASYLKKRTKRASELIALENQEEQRAINEREPKPLAS